VVKIEEQNLEIDIDSTLGIAIMQDNALKKANNALKNAKKTHKRYVVYNSSLDIDSITENIKVWRERIKDAIEHDLITPFYQPIYNRDNKIEKYETLMRMKEVSENNEVKYVSPFFFLDIATKTKQYARLSEIVIRKSLQFAKEGTHSVSINLGFSDIEDPNILNMLDEYFNKDTEEFCKRVVFEILESDHITDYEIFEEFIFKYRALGLRFAIDDFGTGYSNFTHILTVRPDYLKIDGSLIKNVHEDKDSLELVKSIIRFSQELHIKTIAEYVHNKEVYDIVYDLGVDEFQGYYLDEPKVNI
jgi:EAL domain-containing protein (putative c-di-GMP-specific phosphodiesterase class I)